jgi:hypothetical protein
MAGLTTAGFRMRRGRLVSAADLLKAGGVIAGGVE